jgi:hypothetical protein
MRIELLAAVTTAAVTADFCFWVADYDGGNERSEFFASASQAIESLSDPGEGWVRVDESSWGRREANPLAGFVDALILQAAILAAFEAGINAAEIEAAIEAGRA